MHLPFATGAQPRTPLREFTAFPETTLLDCFDLGANFGGTAPLKFWGAQLGMILDYFRL